MKILAIDTSGPALQIALSAGGHLRDENGRNASAVLMPGVDKLLADANIELTDLDAVACVIGPGSFTGIRIGVSSVRAICYALDKPAVPLNYLRMLAYNVSADGKERILCISDGSNGTAYIAEFDGARREISPVRCVSLDFALTLAENYDGVVCADERISERCPKAVAPDKDCAALIRAAAAIASEGTCSWEQLVPLYVRESQAEKDLREKESRA